MSRGSPALAVALLLLLTACNGDEAASGCAEIPSEEVQQIFGDAEIVSQEDRTPGSERPEALPAAYCLYSLAGGETVGFTVVGDVAAHEAIPDPPGSEAANEAAKRAIQGPPVGRRVRYERETFGTQAYVYGEHVYIRLRAHYATPEQLAALARLVVKHFDNPTYAK